MTSWPCSLPMTAATPCTTWSSSAMSRRQLPQEQDFLHLLPLPSSGSLPAATVQREPSCRRCRGRRRLVFMRVSAEPSSHCLLPCWLLLDPQASLFNPMVLVAEVESRVNQVIPHFGGCVYGSPDDSCIGAKTTYAVSRNQFCHELDEVYFEIQATNPNDMYLEVLMWCADS